MKNIKNRIKEEWKCLKVPLSFLGQFVMGLSLLTVLALGTKYVGTKSFSAGTLNPYKWEENIQRKRNIAENSTSNYFKSIFGEYDYNKDEILNRKEFFKITSDFEKIKTTADSIYNSLKPFEDAWR